MKGEMQEMSAGCDLKNYILPKRKQPKFLVK